MGGISISFLNENLGEIIPVRLILPSYRGKPEKITGIIKFPWTWEKIG